MKKLLAAIFSLSLVLAGCSSISDAEVQAPVIGYLDALHDGDYEAAAAYAADDELDSISSEIVDALDSAGLGDESNERATQFAKFVCQQAVQSYEITSTDINSKDKTAVVTAEVTGTLDEMYDSMDDIYSEHADEFTNAVMDYIAENEDKDEDELMAGAMNVVLDMLESYLAELHPTTYTLQFQVEQVDGEWKVTEASEVE
jgi:hypothetical protein